MMEEHPTCIRFDPERITKEEIKGPPERDGVEKVEDHPVLPYALWISGYDYLGGLETFEEGLFYVQDASSMMAVGKPAVKKGDSIIDCLCRAGRESAPCGGKSLREPGMWTPET